MKNLTDKILIEGITESGETFRPSDWAERMSGKLSTYEKHRTHYSPLLQPMLHEGHKCMLLDPRLKETNPELYQSILKFARNNHLKICGEMDENASNKNITDTQIQQDSGQ